MRKLLSKLGLSAISGSHIENGFMIGFTYEYHDPDGEEDKHLSVWFGVFVVTFHLR